jgi:single-stranded-DNA-specific exonuclease
VSPVDETAVRALARDLGLSDITARVLAARGFADPGLARAFLSPSLERDWLDPGLIPGMTAAAARVAAAIGAGERILVFGDFDLDGVSAAAVAARGLARLGGVVETMVPHRFREGYGLSAEAIERAMSYEPSLIVTVDCGVSSGAEVRLLKSRDVDVVVTDHHEPGELTPAGIPVANPKLEPDNPSRTLAGAGVALKLVQAVGRSLGDEEVWLGLTDLAMLGTVADVVELTGENRALVAAGLELAHADPRTCLRALCTVAGLNIESLSADNIAFALAPRLNAAGRMADPAVALELLLTDDPARADEGARALDELNRTRQAVEAELAAAASELAKRTYSGERVLMLAGEGWHDGVKGIVASRLTSEYGVPTILFSIEDGMARGSGRSVGQVDLFRAVDSAAELLDRFGGHAAAVGLTLPETRLEELKSRLLAHLDALPDEQFSSPLHIDAEVPLDALSVELGAELSALEPFGHGNRRPLLAARGAYMNSRSRVGKSSDHLKFTAYDGVATVPAIAFRCRDIDSLAGQDAAVDLAFELDVDEWRGRRRVQLLVRDVAVRAEASMPQGFVGELLEDLFARADEIIAREEYSGVGDAPSFHTKLAGVTFEGRQESVAVLEPGVPLRIARQPDNPHDANAIALFDPHGSQVGFFNRRLAAALAPVIDAGVEYDVEVTDVTGGDEGRSRGVNVLVTRRDAAADEVQTESMRVARRAELECLTAEELDAELTTAFIGDRSLHPAQAEALASLAEGISTLAVMATGRGKSLIFHLHAARTALAGRRASVFVYPLRALVADQAFHLAESFAGVGLSVRVVTGETGQTQRDEAFDALAAGDLDTVLTTPEFLHFHAHRFARAGTVGFVVVDEAHHVGLARAGNRPAYARLGDAIEKLGSPTVLAVTATASDEVALRIKDTLGIERFILDPTVRDNLVIEDRRDGADKDAHLCSLARTGGKVVIYVNSRDASVRLARMLRKRVPEVAWKTAFYNGGLSRSVRHAVETAFRSGEVQVVIATSAFGEGVNIPDIRHVVLYHLPFSDVEFNQMAGRAGRDGMSSTVSLLFGEKDARINRVILSTLAPSREDLATLYRVLRSTAGREGEGFEVTNAELAAACTAQERSCSLDDRGVSTALGVFRDLGLVIGEGHGAYRRLTLVPDPPKMELSSSVRYTEGLDEIEQFTEFQEWVMSADAEELLARFNRPILPSHH